MYFKISLQYSDSQRTDIDHIHNITVVYTVYTKSIYTDAITQAHIEILSSVKLSLLLL